MVASGINPTSVTVRRSSSTDVFGRDHYPSTTCRTPRKMPLLPPRASSVGRSWPSRGTCLSMPQPILDSRQDPEPSPLHRHHLFCLSPSAMNLARRNASSVSDPFSSIPPISLVSDTPNTGLLHHHSTMSLITTISILRNPGGVCPIDVTALLQLCRGGIDIIVGEQPHAVDVQPSTISITPTLPSPPTTRELCHECTWDTSTSQTSTPASTTFSDGLAVS
ncbi:hypothetical protein GE09DRAFT_176569 [Coniochaeta sp. 2T2.1]|nr:hypothetical protein GE09DRAFT_176569 [Coniochaeta sp. 2T2.1]